MSSYVHIDNKGKDILILGEGPTQGLDYTTSTAEAINVVSYNPSILLLYFAQPNIRFVLILHYDESNSFLFVNATKTYKCKAKNSEIKDYALC